MTADDPTPVTAYADVEAALRHPALLQGSHAESQLLYGDTLLLLDGEAHHERRRVEAPLFDTDALVRYERGHLSDAIHRCLAERGTMFDLVPLMQEVLLQVAAAVTGIDGIDTPEATERFAAMVDGLAAAAHVEWSTEDHEAVLARGRAVKAAYVEGFLGPSLRRRERLAAAGDPLPEDLVALVVAAGGLGRRQLGEDPDLLVRESILYLLATTQTTTHGVPHVVAELTGWLRTNPTRRGELGEVDFLQRASAEALRLHPPVPALLRRATAPVELPSGLQVAAGERLALDLLAANTDASVMGADATSFDPDRALPRGVKPYGMSFGGGIHVCIGRSLAVGMMSSAARRSGDAPIGMMTLVLQALLAAGVEPDPDTEPRRTTRSAQGYYEAFPVVRRTAGRGSG